MTLYKQKIIDALPLVSCILLIAFIAIQLANITLDAFFDNTALTQTDNNTHTLNSKQVNRKPKNAVINSAKEISQKHLLGKADAVQAQEVKPIDAPETKLDLSLRGILATGSEDGLAIIAQGSQAEKMYKIGDALPGGATLKAVYADKVLIESSQGLETLRIELDKNRLSDIASSSNSRQPILGKPAQSTSNLAKLRRDIIRNPLSFTQKISIKPQKDESGKLLGYQLNPSKDKALFTQLGLAPGDIATQINGLDLSDGKNARRAMNILRRSKKISMTVLRNGQEIQIEQTL